MDALKAEGVQAAERFAVDKVELDLFESTEAIKRGVMDVNQP